MTRLCLSTLLLTARALSQQILLDPAHVCEVACEGPSCLTFVDVNPKNGVPSCCPPDTFWTTDLDHPKEGKCCPAGTSYSFDPSVQNGDCCLPGQLFLSTACRSISAPARSLQTSGGPCPSCGNGNVCSYSGNLGIRYNHCYTMKDSGGNEIRRSVNTEYINQDLDVSGERGIPFRICASSTNCSVNMDQYVPEGGTWLQLDEQGYRADTTNSPGWMSFLPGYLYMVVTPTSTAPTSYILANFTGKGTCIFGDCAICIKFASATGTANSLGLSSYTGSLGSAPIPVQNTRQCKPFYYEETSCIGPSNVAPN